MEESRYAKFYNRRVAFHRRMAGVLRFLNVVATGAIVLLYAATLALALFQKNYPAFSWRFLKLLVLPLSCLIFVNLLRKAVRRKRPYEDGRIEPIFPKSNAGDSFPSRHISCAFVIGAVALCVRFPLALSAFGAGLVLSYVRFACGWHYPSDLICGGAIGLIFGLFALV